MRVTRITFRINEFGHALLPCGRNFQKTFQTERGWCLFRVTGEPVGHRVEGTSHGGVASVVQLTVGHADGSEECPDVGVRPVEDRVHTHEGGPAHAAGAE